MPAVRVFVDTDNVVGVAYQELEFRGKELGDIEDFVHQKRIDVVVCIRCSGLGRQVVPDSLKTWLFVLAVRSQHEVGYRIGQSPRGQAPRLVSRLPEPVIENFARSVYPTLVKTRVQDTTRVSCTRDR